MTIDEAVTDGWLVPTNHFQKCFPELAFIQYVQDYWGDERETYSIDDIREALHAFMTGPF